MSATLDWTNLLVRWFHIVAGIAWIGSSFYFVWLDRNLTAPAKGDGPGDARVEGELWMVHSGGFYHVEKRRLGPGELPSTLHWVKWEATLNWASGMFLLAVVYYLTGGVYLLDEAVSSMTVTTALGFTVVALGGGWIIYDALWRSSLGRAVWPATLISLVLLVAITFASYRMLSGRAAFIHVGTLLGTLMVVNVWAVIIPAQRRMVDATARGVEPDHTLGVQAKMRSLHNSYLTFPVIFTMVSSHFPQTYAGRDGWLILLLFALAGAAARHAMIGRRVSGVRKEWALVPMVAGVAAAIVLATPGGAASEGPRTAGAADASDGATFAEARVVIAARCASCHSSAPTDAIFTAAPNGVAFDTPQQIRGLASLILERAVVQRTMPFANRTGMSDDERDVLRRWIESGARLR